MVMTVHFILASYFGSLSTLYNQEVPLLIVFLTKFILMYMLFMFIQMSTNVMKMTHAQIITIVLKKIMGTRVNVLLGLT